LKKAKDVVEKFNRENPEMPGPNLAESDETGFQQVEK